MRWDTLSKKIICGCENGNVFEVEKPNPKNVDNTETFLVDLPKREWKMKMMEF